MTSHTKYYTDNESKSKYKKCFGCYITLEIYEFVIGLA
jgi:hypothetical protein